MPARALRLAAVLAAVLGAAVGAACDPSDLVDPAEGEGEANEGEGEANEGEGEAGEGEGEGEGEPGEGEGEPVSSGCSDDGDAVDCPFVTRTLELGFGFGARQVHVAVPRGDAPAAGWAVVVFFQGSLFSAVLSFEGTDGDAFGRFHLARTVQALLDEGFAVVAPEAFLDGNTAWQTNVPPMSIFWEGSGDDRLMNALFDALADGSLVDDGVVLDDDRLYATGISSGGFMTSRMAVSYPGRFRALAIHSAGYATCSAVCLLPSSLPDDHPPTLFLHGAGDLVVTPGVMRQYRDALDDDGVEVDSVVDDDEGHAWIAGAVTAVPAWFRER